MPNKAKILLFDIETSAIVGDSWQMYDTRIHHTRRNSSVLSFAFKWLGSKRIGCETRQFQSEKSMLKKLAKLLNRADIVVAHNGNQFDIKKVNARFAVYGITQPHLYQQIDTKLIAKRYFNFDSNSLNDLAKLFALGAKYKHIGYDMWLGCEENDPHCWKLMEHYNKQDVELLEGVYLKMRPFIVNHPNVSLEYRQTGCNKCGSKEVVKKGIRANAKGLLQQFLCKACGGWFLGPFKPVKR